jgi:predicted MFS family arabinose efflux permease
MGSAAMSLLIGKFYGLFETKYIMMVSLMLFEAGSVLCGAAPTMNVLIAGRVIAGIGG